MLPHGDSTQLTRLLQTLPCRVAIPDWYLALVGRGTNPSRTLPDERRRFTRFNFPVKAVMTCGGNLPALPRTTEPHVVLCKDLSRSGICLLHAEQLYPGEEILLWLATGRKKYTVRRCRRHQPQCFEIGVQ